MATNGARRFLFPANPDLANMLGDIELEFENFHFYFFWIPHFWISRFPDFQNLAWAGPGRVWTLGWVGPPSGGLSGGPSGGPPENSCQFIDELLKTISDIDMFGIRNVWISRFPDFQNLAWAGPGRAWAWGRVGRAGLGPSLGLEPGLGLGVRR